MARMRMVRPEFFQHEELHALEKTTGLPVRLGYIGLWTLCDRDGRFRWLPKTMKLSVFPWDDVDMAAVLEALKGAGFIKGYRADGKHYGYIPSWGKHQKPHPKEPAACPCPTTGEQVVNQLQDSGEQVVVTYPEKTQEKTPTTCKTVADQLLASGRTMSSNAESESLTESESKSLTESESEYPRHEQESISIASGSPPRHPDGMDGESLRVWQGDRLGGLWCSTSTARSPWGLTEAPAFFAEKLRSGIAFERIWAAVYERPDRTVSFREFWARSEFRQPLPSDRPAKETAADKAARIAASIKARESG